MIVSVPPEFARIIVSIQTHDKDDLVFQEFHSSLKSKFGEHNVIIVIGASSSSFDDFNIAFIVTTLLPKSKKKVISSDKFKDLHKVTFNPDGSMRTEKIFKNHRDHPDLVCYPIDILCETLRTKLQRTRTRTYEGGTNKNKKLLLNKYTRKIKNSKKVKTLHKKRNTSKKVVKKYNKNYKKKTLRRKNK